MNLVDGDIDLAQLARIGQGRTAEVFALGDDRVIKVARADSGDLLEREVAAMRAAHDADMPVPAAHRVLDIDGRRALIMSRAHGVDMLTQFAVARGRSFALARSSGGCTRSSTRRSRRRHCLR